MSGNIGRQGREMNIKEAKEQIKRSVGIYLEKDGQGEYLIPYMRQRPVLMMGPPGIGKTAVVEQIAEELDIALVMYSMTQHTRQSVAGRPMIRKKKYGGRALAVTEYTVSELLAAIYHVMEQSGKEEGILFLDEINCASEALTPVLYRLFRYKKLGNGTLPEGWVIVTAGSLPQYNRSARPFDLTALDRMRYVEVEPDFHVWKQYAYRQGIHAAILTFLEVHRDCFYSVQAEKRGMYVTARGWEDLSRAIQAYEKKGYPVDRNLVMQYVLSSETAGRFRAHYGLFQECEEKYRIDEILNGRTSDEVIEQIQEAEPVVRMLVLGMLLEKVNLLLNQVVRQERVIRQIRDILDSAKKEIELDGMALHIILKCECIRMQTILKQKRIAHGIGTEAIAEYNRAFQIIQGYAELTEGDISEKEQVRLVKRKLNSRVKEHENQWNACGQVLESVISFVKHVWGEEQGLELFFAELTMNEMAAAFLARWDARQTAI